MFGHRKYKILQLSICIVWLASACGSPSQTQLDISTAVAQTVQARDSLTEAASIPTITPEMDLEPTATPESPAATTTSAPTLVSAPPDPNCIGASLVGENPPDGVILGPGEYFWKTWTFRNTGTCAWDSSYELVYRSGDLMGGLVSYPLPEPILPGEQKEISIYLKAPETEGTFTGYWQLQTPWEANFGVGPYDEPIYVQVVVSDDRKPKYGITSVTYEVVRDPPIGCPTNVRYTVNATITTNGPFEFEFFWNQSDENESGKRMMEFTEAGSRTISREWMVGKGDSPNPRWIAFIVTMPKYQEYGKAIFLNNCP
ncbi:MAG TPA: NBR1-Ig-like domain-containing protein [Anaerolineales bacterium]|nr:NBR1-Ig-like domain-containing protein [Anaerolineales bacterium]